MILKIFKVIKVYKNKNDNKNSLKILKNISNKIWYASVFQTSGGTYLRIRSLFLPLNLSQENIKKKDSKFADEMAVIAMGMVTILGCVVWHFILNF